MSKEGCTRDMTRARVAICTVIGLVVIAAAAGSSLWAHQVIAEHSASSTYDHARGRLSADLNAARTAGMWNSELQPFTTAAAALSSAPPPANKTFWSSDTAAFYAHQAKQFDALDARVRAALEDAVATARSHTAFTIGQYRQAISRASYLGLPTGHFWVRLDSARQGIASARTLREYRRLNQSLQPAMRWIHWVIAQRASHLQNLQNVVGSAGDQIAALRDLAQQKATAAENDLDSLRLFRAHPGFGQPLAQLERRLRTQSRFHPLLLTAADLDDLSARIHGAYVHAAPAKWILVSTEGQWARMYEGTNQVYSTLVTTGGPQLPTDHGFFHIYMKLSPFTFHSPWPPGSQYWYPDSPVQYWMPFYGGEGLHDAPWRSVFGPGSNYLPTPGTQIDGTHGCVNLPADAATFVWNWAPVGTDVIVV